MGNWYIVTKTIKGRAYLYKQKTWRKNGKMHTQSVYIGRKELLTNIQKRDVRKIVNTTKRRKLTPKPQENKTVRLACKGMKVSKAELQLIETLFDPVNAKKKWEQSWTEGEGWQAAKQKPDKKILELASSMGVVVITQPFVGEVAGSKCRYNKDGSWWHTKDDVLHIADASRFRAHFGNTRLQNFYGDFLHELTHATKWSGRSEREKISYTQEEMVAELGSNIAAMRLGVARKSPASSAKYIQVWLSKVDDPLYLRAYGGKRQTKRRATFYAVREALRAADFIMQVYKSKS